MSVLPALLPSLEEVSRGKGLNRGQRRSLQKFIECFFPAIKVRMMSLGMFGCDAMGLIGDEGMQRPSSMIIMGAGQSMRRMGREWE